MCGGSEPSSEQFKIHINVKAGRRPDDTDQRRRAELPHQE